MPTSTTHARTPLAQHIRELAAFEPTAFPMLSLYLDLRSDQHGRVAHDGFLRKALAERARSLHPGSPERESFERDADRIGAWLRDEKRPSSNGVALFACTGCGSFFDAVQLDAPIDRHALFVGSVPHIYPLVRLVDVYPRYAAVMLDTHQARIFVFGLNTVERAAEVTNQKTKRTSVGGWSQARYQRHVENFQIQHVKEVVDTLDRIVADEGVAHVVAIGDDVAVPLLRDQLPKRLQEKLVDTVRLERTAGERDILEATLDALRAKDAETDAEHVARMFDAWRAGGLGVAGLEPTLEALDLGQVDELLVTSRSEPSTTDETLVALAERTGARVRFIEDPSLLDAADGVGALLRFRL